MATYCFGVYEGGTAVAAYIWQPPPPGAAKSACPEAPYGVLSLSRMVAVPKAERRLKHVSKPLKKQMRNLIDRTRWPVPITYSDEGQGHTGYVYQCSGWERTKRSKSRVYETKCGKRASSYSNGKCVSKTLIHKGSTYIQRWEHWVCPRGTADGYMKQNGWARVPVEGKVWRSGKQAYTLARGPQPHVV